MYVCAYARLCTYAYIHARICIYVYAYIFKTNKTRPGRNFPPRVTHYAATGKFSQGENQKFRKTMQKLGDFFAQTPLGATIRMYAEKFTRERLHLTVNTTVIDNYARKGVKFVIFIGVCGTLCAQVPTDKTERALFTQRVNGWVDSCFDERGNRVALCYFADMEDTGAYGLLNVSQFNKLRGVFFSELYRRPKKAKPEANEAPEMALREEMPECEKMFRDGKAERPNRGKSGKQGGRIIPGTKFEWNYERVRNSYASHAHNQENKSRLYVTL